MLVPVPDGVLRSPLNRNGSVTVIYCFIDQIPGKRSSTIGGMRHIFKLIRRIEPVFRTGDNITCHHVVQTLKCPITDIGIRLE